MRLAIMLITLLLAGCAHTQPRYHTHHHHRHMTVDTDEPVFVEHEGKLYELR